MLANIVTLTRLLLIPIFVWLAIVYPEYRLVVAAVFGLAALTDWLDGLVARKLNQITEFGEVFDPLVDRLLVFSALGVLYVSGVIAGWAVAVLLAREVIVVLGYQLLKLKKQKLLVSLLGKVATAVLFVSFFMLLLKIDYGMLAFYLGLLLYVISCFDYMIKGLSKLWQFS